MTEPTFPKIGLVSADADLIARFAAVAETAGVELCPAAAPGETDGIAVLVDGGHPGAGPEWVKTCLGANRTRSVVWLSTTLAAPATAAALGAGADDAWDPRAPTPLLWTRLRRLIEIARLRAERVGDDPAGGFEVRVAAYAEQLEASQQNLEELYNEVEAQARELQTVLAVQQDLITRQVPEEIVDRVRSVLTGLFPDGGVAFRPAREATGPGEKTVETTRTGRWTRARLPLRGRSRVLGEVEVACPRPTGYPHRQLDLLEVFAGQAAHALERSHLYQSLSQGKAEWERTFDAIPDAIAIIDRDFVILRTNRAMADRARLHPREVVGCRCHDILYHRDGPCEECVVATVFETGEEARIERQIRRKDKVYAYRAYPLRGDDGEVYAAISYARDVTREADLARSLQQSEKLMTLGQIAAGIAHEINNPLTAVSSYAQLLAMRLESPENRESAHRIEQGIERIHRLVQNLMSFVRPEREDFYPLNLNEIVADTLSFSRYEITRGETRLEEDLATALPKVLGSKEQLEHILVNLLTNARDAVGGRGTIRIRTLADDGPVCLEVTDDGVGIDPEKTERMFDPFFTTKPPGQGTGLGLFIAAGIARQHGGDIRVESTPGRGTRMTLCLPPFAQ